MPTRPRPNEELLKNDDEAIGFLTACNAEGGLPLFLEGLQTVARAKGGVALLAKKMKLPRQSLYRALSKTGNPEARIVWAAAESLGFRILAVPKTSKLKLLKRHSKMAKAI